MQEKIDSKKFSARSIVTDWALAQANIGTWELLVDKKLFVV